VPGAGRALAVATDGFGNAIVAGAAASGASTVWAVRAYAPDGSPLWEFVDRAAPAGRNEARAVAVDARGRVYAAGVTDQSAAGLGTDWLVRCLGPHGVPLWDRKHGSPGGGLDAADALALSPGGDVIVAGSEERAGPGSGPRWLARAWSADGEPRWLAPYDSPGRGASAPAGVAAAADGAFIAAGWEDRADLGLGDEWTVSRVLGAPCVPTLDAARTAAAFPNPVAGDVFRLAVQLEVDAAELTVEAYNAAATRVFARTWRGLRAGSAVLPVDGVASWAPGRYLVRARVTDSSGGSRILPPVKVVVRR
ncbi:MAG: hypothetical protein AAB368_00415, partial [bacterium]